MVATSDAVARVRYVSLLTTAAMVAFAANSVLCRAGLGGGEIDVVSFSAIRLSSGALALAAIQGSIAEKGEMTLQASRSLVRTPVAFPVTG